jgi:hypothetical protein
MRAHRCGGGYADEQERLLPFLLLFLFIIIYSTLTPSSFIPCSLDLHIRQVDDCVADDKEVMLEGGQVDMQAEEVEEHVGVDLSVGVVGKKSYEEPECGSAADFLLGVEIESNECETVPAPPTKPSFSLEPNERETVPAWTFERESKSGHPTISLFALASNERQTVSAPHTKLFALELNERESVPVPPTKPLFVLEPNEHESVPAPPHSFTLEPNEHESLHTPPTESELPPPPKKLKGLFHRRKSIGR